MGKRESVKKDKLPRDFYPTVDPAALNALAPFLGGYSTWIEPCAGGGHLMDEVRRVAPHMGCVGAYDIDPQRAGITQRNCLTLNKDTVQGVHCAITNPPFSWPMLKPILDHLPDLLPTWLLLPADLMHNVRMGPYMQKCSKVVSIGRLYWFKDQPIKGVDNFAFYLFETPTPFTIFYGRNNQ